MISIPLPSSSSSFSLFNIFHKLIQLYKRNLSGNIVSNSQIKEIQEDFYDIVKSISPNKYQNLLFNFLKCLANKDNIQSNNQASSNQFISSFKAFLQHYSQTKSRILNCQNVANNFDQVKIIVFDRKSSYSLQDQLAKLNKIEKSKSKNQSKKNIRNSDQDQINYKAYVIYGKAVNVQKKKKVNPTSFTTDGSTTNFDDSQSKDKAITQIEYIMTRMYEQQKLPYIKSEPHDLEDLILTHQLDDSSVVPIIVSNQIYRNFVPLDFVILLVIPDQLTNQQSKAQVPSIFRDTLLHVFLDNYKSVSRTLSKQSYFKNSTFRGIFFVDEGEVQTKSGRIVARGWIVYGKCKSTTTVWKFNKVITFFKFIIENQNIWKQFVNDLKLNGQWPLKVADILNIDQKHFQQLMGEQGAAIMMSGKGIRNNRKLRFPPISGRLNKSFDIQKLSEIQKVKHFNEKINHLSDFKQEILRRKLQNLSKKQSLYAENKTQSEASEKQMNKKIQFLSQKYSVSQKGLKTDNSRSVILRPGQSSANILITGIVNKLKSMHQSQNASQVNSSRQQSKKKVKQLNRSRAKILGLQRYEQILKNEKNHLHKGKNIYH